MRFKSLLFLQIQREINQKQDPHAVYQLLTGNQPSTHWHTDPMVKDKWVSAEERCLEEQRVAAKKTLDKEKLAAETRWLKDERIAAAEKAAKEFF